MGGSEKEIDLIKRYQFLFWQNSKTTTTRLKTIDKVFSYWEDTRIIICYFLCRFFPQNWIKRIINNEHVWIEFSFVFIVSKCKKERSKYSMYVLTLTRNWCSILFLDFFYFLEVDWKDLPLDDVTSNPTKTSNYSANLK